MNLEGKKVLVTGADGYIGSHVVELLLDLGADPRCFVFYNSFGSWGWLDSLPDEVKRNLDVFAGDIRDPFGVRQAMEGCDVVLHLAALIAIPYSYHSPQSYVDTNISGTLNILQAARDTGVSRLVHTSTSECYGSARYVPIDEEHPLTGQSPYSATKIGADQLAESFYRSFDLPVVLLRPFNAYGPRQSARAVIPGIITQLMAGKRNLQLGALTPTRDFTYVKDTARAFVAAATSDDCSLGQVINAGSGFEISIGDTVKMIAEVMNADITIETDEKRLRPDKSEVTRLFACTEKAKTMLNWSPDYAGKNGMRKGIQATVDWFSQPGNMAMYKPDRYVL